MASWLVAFALTQAVELPIFVFGLRRWPLWKRVAVGFAASAATHPWVWFVLPPYLRPSLGYWGYVALVECLVIVAEALFLAGMGISRRRAFGWSAAANVASALVGLWFYSG